MRLSDLYGARVVDAKGGRLGCVREAHAAGGEITHLLVGPFALVARFTSGREGRRIPWSKVTQVKKDGTLVIDA